MQVLQKALGIFGLSCQNLDSPECTKSAQHPENEVAFICNLRVSGSFYVLSQLQLCISRWLRLHLRAHELVALGAC